MREKLHVLLKLFPLCFCMFCLLCLKVNILGAEPFDAEDPSTWEPDTISYTINVNEEEQIVAPINQQQTGDVGDFISVISGKYADITVATDSGTIQIPSQNYVLSVEEGTNQTWKLKGIWSVKYFAHWSAISDFFTERMKTDEELAAIEVIKGEEPEPSLPPLDDGNYWVISVDDSRCTTAEDNEGREPVVTIRSREPGEDGEYIELTEDVDFSVMVKSGPLLPSDRNYLRIYQVKTSQKCGAIRSDKEYIECDFTVHCVNIADYYTLEGPDEVDYEYYMEFPGLSLFANSYEASKEELAKEGFLYLQQKETDMGALPVITENGGISEVPAYLWNKNFLNISYNVNGKEYSSSDEARKAWHEKPTEAIIVKVYIDESKNSHWIHQDVYTRLFKGSVTKEIRIKPAVITDREPGAGGEAVLVGRINPVIVPSSNSDFFYDDVKPGVLPEGTYSGEAYQPAFKEVGIYVMGELMFGGHKGKQVIDLETGIKADSTLIKEIQYSNNVNAGTGTMTVTFNYPYMGSISTDFTIVPKEIDDDTITVEIREGRFVYTGEEILPEITVTDKKRDVVLLEGVDYEIKAASADENRTGPGKAVLTIEGKGNYSGEKTGIEYMIETASISETAIFRVQLDNPVYTGEKLIPEITVTDKRSGEEVDCSYYEISIPEGADNVNAGTNTGKIVLTGISPYSGTVEKSFSILRKDLSKPEVVSVGPEKIELTYTGKAQIPELTLKDLERNAELENLKDYTVAPSEGCTNVNPGTGRVTVSGIGNYKGSRIVEFQIKEASIEESVYQITVGSVTYNGTAQLPEVTVTDTSTGKPLDQSAYTVEAVEGADNTNAGTGKAAITGGRLGGTVVKEFTIEPKALDDTVAITAAGTVYTGKAQLPSVTARDTALNRTLQEGIDFFVYAESGADNVNVGNGKAIVGGIGNYTGSRKVDFAIAAPDTEPPTEPSTEPSTEQPGEPSDQGSDKKGTFSKEPIIVTSRNQRSLRVLWEKKSDYAGYQLYRASKRSGSYKRVADTKRNTAAVRGMKTGTTYYFKVRAYKVENGKKIYGPFTKPLAISTKMAQPKILAAKSIKKGRVALRWKRDGKASGYRIYVKKAGSSRFKLAKELKKGKSTSYTLKGLKSKKNVSIRIRAYKTVNGKRLYSPVSRTVKLRVK